MGLDLTALGQQLRQMSSGMAGHVQATSERIASLATRYVAEAGKEERCRQAVSLSNGTVNWQLAHPVESLDTVRDLPPCPPAYTLLAADGSQIERDRHGKADCYLINTGRVFLHYGDQPTARLSSHPTLYHHDEDLYLRHGARRVPIEGNLLNVHRDIEELWALLALADAHAQPVAGVPTLALLDGTLIRWTLASNERFVQEHFLGRYLAGLAALRERGIPVASYISRPRATELIGMMRLVLCPDVDIEGQRGARCAECSDERAGRPPSCSLCNGLVDADLLAQRLQEGQRGPLCISLSKINMDMYHEHLVHFFYLRVGRELARIELPRWVVQEPALVDRLHSLLYDQYVRGQGYPVALARAHEQAIVRTADRRTFLRMMEGSLLRAELPASSSRKQASKERTAL